MSIKNYIKDLDLTFYKYNEQKNEFNLACSNNVSSYLISKEQIMIFNHFMDIGVELKMDSSNIIKLHIENS